MEAVCCVVLSLTWQDLSAETILRYSIGVSLTYHTYFYTTGVMVS